MLNRVEPVVPQFANTYPYFNVQDYGAVGDGITDDTNAFQQALDAAGNAGGSIVVAPRGNYRIDGVLVIPAHVTLEGVFTAPTAWSQYKGTTLLAYSGRGQEDGVPFITLAGHNGVVKGLAIYYPEQNNPNNIVAYPWTIRGGNSEGSHDNLSIQDVLVVNPYQAVDFGTYECGRHLIRGLYGQPLKEGIFVDRCYDVGRIEDVHFWPFWSEDAIQSFISHQGKAIRLKRSDAQIVHNVFVYGYHVGISFEYRSETPVGATYGVFSNLQFEYANVGLDVKAINPVGVHFTNLNIACAPLYGQTILRAILTHNNVNPVGPLIIQNASFWGDFTEEIINWSHPGGPFQITSSSFNGWQPGMPAIKITRGRATIQGNFFADLTGKSVFVGREADRVVITGNQLTGNPIQLDGSSPLWLVANNLA